MEKYQIIHFRERAKIWWRLQWDRLQRTRVKFVIYIIIVLALIAAILIFPAIVPIDDKLERVSAVIGIIVKILTALSLLTALVWAPPYFREVIAKEYLKDLVKATQEADVKVFRKTIILLDTLSNPDLENGIVPKSDITYFKEAFAELKLLALEGKTESATLVTLTYQMLRHLEHEYDETSKHQKLPISNFTNSLVSILKHISYLSSAVVKLPRSNNTRKVPIANVSLKRYVSEDKYEEFKEYPRGINVASDAPMPLLFFDILNERGTIHLLRAAAIYRTPEPFFLRILDIHKVYLPPRIVSDKFRFIDNRLFPFILIGFNFEISGSNKPPIVKAWYSNLDRFFVLMQNKNPEQLKAPFTDVLINKDFFKHVVPQNTRFVTKETIEITLHLDDVKKYFKKHRGLIEYAIHHVDALEKEGKEIGDKI